MPYRKLKMGMITAPALWIYWKLETLPLEMGMRYVLQHLQISHYINTQATKNRTNMTQLLGTPPKYIILLTRQMAQLKKKM